MTDDLENWLIYEIQETGHTINRLNDKLKTLKNILEKVRYSKEGDKE